MVAGCVSYVDTKCTCPSTAFKNTVEKCLTAACTEEDIEGKIDTTPVLRPAAIVCYWRGQLLG